MKKILQVKEDEAENTAISPKEIAKWLDKLFFKAFTIAVVLNIGIYFIICKVKGANLNYFSH